MTLAPKWVSRQLRFCTLPQSLCTDADYWIQCESSDTLSTLAQGPHHSTEKEAALRWQLFRAQTWKMLNPQTPNQPKSLSAYLSLQTHAIACSKILCRQARQGPKTTQAQPNITQQVQPDILCFNHKTGSHLNNSIRQASMKFCINKTKIKSR